MSSLDHFDDWFHPRTGPAALVIREPLVPVEGHDGVFFPPTFAENKKSDFKGGYNIDSFSAVGENAANVCLVDSVGSQANRIEPIFAEQDYASLVPQITIVAGDQRISLFDVGHRAGDALVRCTELQKELRDAFLAVMNGDANPLAKIAPTSLVFGAWDSRGTYAKVPRLIASTVRAYDVRKLTRSAQYIPPVDYSALDVFTEAEKEKAEGNASSPQAQQGFVHVPAPASHGGVIADGEIRRDATLSLAALRLLTSVDDEATLKLRRYVLGLSLVALTANMTGYLRQGCNLVPDIDGERTFKLVGYDGERSDADVSHKDALSFAMNAAKAFGVGEGREVTFSRELAKVDVGGKAAAKKKAMVKKKASTSKTKKAAAEK